MKIISMTFCCVLALAAVNPVWAADTGKTSSAEDTTGQVQALDQNGKPMTAQEFDQAYQAQLQARTKAIEARLKARQEKWKRNKTQDPTNGTEQ